ncbi:hypothetical protein PhCBS80983_g04345 [Powellomyces hirtus]|uniref:Uncharacterized protein n=1 Tax=Powellomyces hirtus TaxID=109895 RepID=A0A507E005_9FUNG|nr:hypothetical protein PhCBS80983_g04345 [Powellomyces hirtus]
MIRPASTRVELSGGLGTISLVSPVTAAPAAGSKSRPHFGHHGAHHVPLGRTDRTGDLGISFQVKQAIIENSPARLSNYDPKEVAVRTEQTYALKDSNATRLARIQRRADVYQCGFCSDAKDFYKPLGDPVLNSDMLVYGTLRIDPNSVQRSHDTKVTEAADELSEIKVSARRPSADTSPRHNNGFEHIKEKLAKSKGRMDAVKFGIPFSQTIDDSAWRHRVDPKSGKTDTQFVEGQVDWHRLKVDTDKQAYFQNVLEREMPGFITQKRRKIPKASLSRDKPQERWGTLVDKRPRTGRLLTPARGEAEKDSESRSVSNTSLSDKSSAKGLTAKAMEQALNIHRDDRINLATDQYYTTREHFYEQRRRLTQVLLDDLNRLDFERKAQFVRKYRAFHIGKNNMFSEDMKAMRRKSDRQRNAEKNQLLRQHPWYTELVTKVVLSGAKKHLSEYEELLISRVKCVIEDNLPFTQNTFVQLMKMIPAHEFMKDDIQRIIRFVKAHGNITEREYLEAVEMAGHMNNTSK